VDSQTYTDYVKCLKTVVDDVKVVMACGLTKHDTTDAWAKKLMRWSLKNIDVYNK
jgi:hypothetical protein